MKKNLVYVAWVSLLVLAGCSMDDMRGGERMVNEIQASFEQGASASSRVAIDGNNQLTWTEGDAFIMYDEKGSNLWTLSGKGGDAVGTFTGEFPSGKMKGAAYPASETTTLDENNWLKVVLPSRLEYNPETKGKCNLPMWATFSSYDDAISFRHLGAMLKVNFSDIPEGMKFLIVEANKPLAGDFVAEVLNEDKLNPVLLPIENENTKTEIVVSFSAISNSNDNDRTFFIPLPVNNFDELKVSISNGTNTYMVRTWTKLSVERKKMYVANLSYTVTDASTEAGVSEALENLTMEEPTIKLAMTEAITATSEAIQIPVIEETATQVQLDFEQVPVTTTETPLKVQEKKEQTSTANTNSLAISIPVTNEAVCLDVNTPNTTVNLESGNFGTISATTAQNTLVVGKGTTIGRLDVNGGNVRVSSDGKITGEITNHSDKDIYILLEEGATEENLPAQENIKSKGKGKVKAMRSFNNVQLSYALHMELGGDKVKLDENGYARMTKEDVEAITELDFGTAKYQITSMHGIEQFKHLKRLVCNEAGLQFCDLSKNKELEYIELWLNELTRLDLKNFRNLKHLNCQYNYNLATLDLKNCDNLEVLLCGSAAVNTINIENPEKLVELDYNHTLLVLDLNRFKNLRKLWCAGRFKGQLGIPSFLKAQLTDLQCQNSSLTSIDLREYPNLLSLQCYHNNLKELNLEGAPDLAVLRCFYNYISDLDITPLSNLQILDCGTQYNNIVQKLTATASQVKFWEEKWSKDEFNSNVVINQAAPNYINFDNKELSKALYGLLGADLVSLDADGCAVMDENVVKGITQLNFEWDEYKVTSLAGIEKFVNLRTLQCPQMGIQFCDLSQNKKLTEVQLAYNELTSLDLNSLKNLHTLRCYANRNLTSLSIENCSNLEQIYVSETALTSITIPNKENIIGLGYGGTSLSFDLNQFPALTSLDVYDLNLTNLDFIPDAIKKQLFSLDVSNNQLTSLDLKQFPALEYLYCTNNQLTTLDLSGELKLKNLNCQFNQIRTLDITSLTNLEWFYGGLQRNGYLVLTLTDDQKALWHERWKGQYANGNIYLKGEEPVEIPEGIVGGEDFSSGGIF